MRKKIQMRKGNHLGFYDSSCVTLIKSIQSNDKPKKKGGEKSMKKILGYVGFAIALLAQIAGFSGIIPVTIANLIGGLFGFGGLIAVRCWIEAKGLKTKIIGGLGILASILVGVNVLPLTAYFMLIGFLGTLAGVTITQAIAKAGAKPIIP